MNKMMSTTSIIKLLFIPALISLMLLTACGDDKEAAKSMEQIQEEEGIPVQIETVKYQPFQKFQSYFSKLAGIKEATKGAPLGGKVARINFRVGDYVKEDQIVMEFPQDQPGAMYDQAKAAYDNSEKTYQRMKTLLAAGETSQANFDGVEAQYIVNKRNYEAARKLIFIEAPFNGTVVDVRVKEGDNVKSEASLFTVAQLNKMRAKIWVTEREIGEIKRGMTASINFGGKEYRGKIVEVSMSVDPYKQAFYAEVEFDNSRNELKSGVTVEVKTLVYENPQAVIVSRNLVMNDENGQYVFVENNGVAEMRYISNGNDSGVYYEVSKGLNVGDKLITRGVAQLTDGVKVNVIQ
jgi:RND family efflux transporter MFP subunit